MVRLSNFFHYLSKRDFKKYLKLCGGKKWDTIQDRIIFLSAEASGLNAVNKKHQLFWLILYILKSIDLNIEQHQCLKSFLSIWYLWCQTHLRKEFLFLNFRSHSHWPLYSLDWYSFVLFSDVEFSAEFTELKIWYSFKAMQTKHLFFIYSLADRFIEILYKH